MSLYDTFESICPSCLDSFQIQTKLYGSTMRTFKIGSHIPNGGVSERLGLKFPCTCELPLVAIIEDGILTKFDHGEPTCVEGIWGKRCKNWKEAQENAEKFHADLLGLVKQE